MIIENDARLTARKQGQEIQGGIVLSIFDEQQISVGHEGQRIATSISPGNPVGQRT